MINYKPAFRKLLLKLLKWTEKGSEQAPAVRGGGRRFWQNEIRLPSPLIVALCMLAFFVVLIFDVGFAWQKIIGLAIFLSIVYTFLSIYIHFDVRWLLKDDEAAMLLGLIFVIGILLMQLSKVWISPYATPLAVTAVLTGLLLSKRLALAVTIILCLIFGVLNNFGQEYTLAKMFGCFAAIAYLPKVRARKDLTRLGLIVALANGAMVITIHLYMFGLSSLGNMWTNVMWSAVSGIASGLIVLGILPYLETFFSRTTNIKLLELADFNQPLLKRLMMDAPGTYHHSLIMASLAEQTAAAIGANSLLARVMAYYHDIGKLLKPEYFIENQQTMGNPHDPLSPTMSSLVVISHVKEGSALAKQYNLDKIIVDAIEQHHGTSLIHYFYHRALEANPNTKPDDFRYPGPKPLSKETAILMLADSAEAASRAIEDPSPGRLKDTVEKVINNKFTDGQFSECSITLHDLSQIAETLAAVLSGIHHARIEYQKTDSQSNDEN
ncbi:MAG: HDIG domain-containing metalloprotein [Elusimicrobiota bacterium]